MTAFCLENKCQILRWPDKTTKFGSQVKAPTTPKPKQYTITWNTTKHSIHGASIPMPLLKPFLDLCLYQTPFCQPFFKTLQMAHSLTPVTTPNS